MAWDQTTWRILAARNLSIVASSGTANSTTSLSAQTYAVDLLFPSATTGSALRVEIGTGVPLATSTSAAIPANWTQRYKVTPGQIISAKSNDAVTGTLIIMELTK